MKAAVIQVVLPELSHMKSGKKSSIADSNGVNSESYIMMRSVNMQPATYTLSITNYFIVFERISKSGSRLA